jgi:hypothetical protein
MRSLAALVLAAASADAFSLWSQKPVNFNDGVIDPWNPSGRPLDWQKLWEERGRPSQEVWQAMEDSDPYGLSLRRDHIEEWSFIETEPGTTMWVAESQKWEMKRVSVSISPHMHRTDLA